MTLPAGIDAGPGDVVATWSDVVQHARPPLVVVEPLEAFLDAAGIGGGPLQMSPIGDGHSNVTFELRRGDERVVLRRPPRPPLPPSAHDVLREAGLMTCLRPAGVRVPRVLATCDDPAVIGAAFYVMEHVAGHVISDAVPTWLDTAARRRVSNELVDALIQIHAVDVRAAGLEGFGRPTGYLDRQLRRFGAIWDSRRTRDVPELDRVAVWLSEEVPESGAATVVHGDYRLGNMIYGGDRSGELLAVLDWEMATLGDPLADLGYLCATWADPDLEDHPMLDLSAATRAPGFASRDDLRERYAARSGRDLCSLTWYEVLALWKCAIFLESSYRRFLDGSTDDPYFASLKDGVPALARTALARTALA